jgi:signal transduction histidine kinase
MPDAVGAETSTSNSPLIAGGGEMGELIRCFDWSRTPIGSSEDWSPALRTMVRVLVANRFPMLLWWGPQYVSIYNDAYRPILGRKHPASLGLPVKECWAEIYNVLKPLIDAPFFGGPATWIEDIELQINRAGFTEETHFTVAYSPVPDETVSGDIGGVLATVHEITEKVIGNRRAAILRDLGSRATEARTAEDACRIAASILRNHPKDIPFALFYLLDVGSEKARLAASCGIEGTPQIAPPHIDLAISTGAPAWSLAIARRADKMQVVERLDSVFSAVPAGPWPEPPHTAVIVPIRSNVAHQLSGFLIAGLSSHVGLDVLYRDFLDLAAVQIATAIANARAYEEERRRAEALAEIDRAKTAFFSNVSHEFRTPLTLMLGPLEEVLRNGTPPENQELITVAHRNSVRLLKLVNSLLDFSRIEAGRIEARFEPLDLASLTAEIASTFRSAMELAGLKFVIDCSKLSEPVYVDREMWEKIVLNLISNAFKFTLKGSIRVAVSARKGAAELLIQDTGTGIPAAELPKLFDRFHRVEGAKGRTHEGTGIGLALVHELVEAHGGTISVESQVDQGTAFTVSIPLGEKHLPPDRILSATPTASTSSRAEAFVQEALRWLPDAGEEIVVSTESQPGEYIALPENRKYRIVLADDNADMRAYVSRLLSPHMEVCAVSNGREALTHVKKEIPDLVLSDVMMPELNGFELLKELRANPETNTLPVILLSARAGEESRIDGVGAGADDYLVKPFSARELFARVSSHLKLAHSRKEALEALRHSEAELRRANEDLSQFAYSASHDLQEPMRNVSIYSQLLQEELAQSANATTQEYLGFVVEGASRMEALLHDLLTYIQVTSNTDAPGASDANVVVSNVLRTLEPAIASSGAEVAVSHLPEALPVSEIHLHQIFQNLIGNGIKYRDPAKKPVIHVSAARQGGRWRFAVKDNGIGIQPEFHKKVFGIFKRLHSTERYPGTGIGLAIVQRIVERYGGQIGVESELGKGATFYFTLPSA